MTCEIRFANGPLSAAQLAQVQEELGDAQDVTITVQTPDGATHNPDASEGEWKAGASGGSYVQNVGDLAANENGTTIFGATIADDVTVGTEMSVTATINGTGAGTEATNSEASDSASVSQEGISVYLPMIQN